MIKVIRVYFFITVKSTGTNSNVKVTDTLGSTYILTLDTESITISSSTGESVELVSEGEYESTAPGEFVRTIKSMSHHETVTITYSANVDISRLGPDAVIRGNDGKNTVNVETGEGNKDENTKIINKISYSDINKVNTSSVENTDGTVTLNWQITGNPESHKSCFKGPIIDFLSPRCIN